MAQETCSRCFAPATRIAFGTWMNGRPVEEPVCEAHAPAPDEIGTIRLYDTWHHTRHSARQYRLAGVR